MKILHIADHYLGFGGIKTYLDDLIPALKKEGIDSIVVTPIKNQATHWVDEAQSILAVNDYGLPQDSFHYPGVLTQEIYPFLKNDRYDLINAHTFTGYTVGASLSKMLSCPLVDTLHGLVTRYPIFECCDCENYSLSGPCIECMHLDDAEYEFRYIDFLNLGIYLDSADKILALNENTKTYVQTVFKVPFGKLDMTKLWIDPPKESKIPVLRHQGRGKLNVSEDDFLILWVGSNRSTKRLDLVLEAFAKIRERISKAILVLVGIEKMELPTEFRGLNHRNEIIAMGRIFDRQEISRLYAASDIFWNPSICETVSFVNLEAMAHQVPVITSQDDNTKDFFIDGENCIRVDPDSEVIANITETLYCDSRKLKQLGRAGYEYVSKMHNPESCIKQILGVYRNVICEHGRV